MFLARGSGVFWSCLGGLLIFRRARELYGAVAGLFALAHWCFEPNILAYAQIISPDLPCSVAALLAGYFFWKYLKEPIGPRADAVGLALGLALLTKFTLLVLLPVGIVVLIVAKRPAGVSVGGVIRQRFGHAILALVIRVLVINLGYLFEGTGRRLGDVPFVNEIFTGEQLDPARGAEGAGNRFRETWLGRLPVPVPEDWLRGIDVQRRDFEQTQNIRPSYLRGEWRQRGW